MRSPISRFRKEPQIDAGRRRFQNPNIGVVMLQNQNGKPLVVGPADAREAKAVFPLVPFDKR